MVIPSPVEVAAAMTGRGGWTKATLKKWGVPWPPRKGWKAKLERAWYEAHEGKNFAVAESAVAEQDFPTLIPLEWYSPD
jgi:hypothetical protein